MPTYVYETIPEDPNAAPIQFEVKQGINDQPLETHPETGERVRRIIAGTAVVGLSGSGAPGKPCGSRCGCH